MTGILGATRRNLLLYTGPPVYVLVDRVVKSRVQWNIPVIGVPGSKGSPVLVSLPPSLPSSSSVRRPRSGGRTTTRRRPSGGRTERVVGTRRAAGRRPPRRVGGSDSLEVGGPVTSVDFDGEGGSVLLGKRGRSVRVSSEVEGAGVKETVSGRVTV